MDGQLATPALSPIDEDKKEPFFTRDRIPSGSTLPSLAESVTANEDENQDRRASSRRRSSDTRTWKLSPKQIHELTTSPDSLPLHAIDDAHDVALLDHDEALSPEHSGTANGDASRHIDGSSPSIEKPYVLLPDVSGEAASSGMMRPSGSSRSASSPVFQRKQSASRSSRPRPQLSPLRTDDAGFGRHGSATKSSAKMEHLASPMPATIPFPPLSLPTYLQLELSSARPSALYIHRPATADFPYESSSVKFERLMNFLMLPPNLEQVLWFGAIACLDAWLYNFTILPLRFIKAFAILVQWFARNAVQEILDIWTYVYGGLGRIWQRRRTAAPVASRRNSEVTRPPRKRSLSRPKVTTSGPSISPSPIRGVRRRSGFRHRRTRSTPSALLPNHKADILQGILILSSCAVLLCLDASRMYHSIRGQSAIKLYVIYNVLEVFDRLFSAIGQDVLECLFSKETLERNSDGRSKVFQPLWMFLLALGYNVLHSTALFYQVVTLNVAVNSYSNALLTLLMSNQFVEIKGSVFKKFEKENLFQMTCADIVERFQLWLMLLIIALRNIVEVGGLNISLSSAFGSSSGGSSTSDATAANATGLPVMAGLIIPKAFTLLPKWTGEVLGPFLIVLGSEALVDWCKHAYIGKFNNVRPNIYGRFLDVLAKDYYAHAFADQNLTKRLGLPVIPLSCLFIRACMQTYHMFLATHMPTPIPALATSLALDNATAEGTSPATTAALRHIDQVFRQALGRSSFGAGGQPGLGAWWTLDDYIALATMVIFFLAIYLLLLAFKLLLGMALLSYSRRRYKDMKERERQQGSSDTHGSRRVGGFGAVEVDEDKRRWIYEDDPEALHELREKEAARRAKMEKGDLKLDNVDRYSMVAKRIW